MSITFNSNKAIKFFFMFFTQYCTIIKPCFSILDTAFWLLSSFPTQMDYQHLITSDLHVSHYFFCSQGSGILLDYIGKSWINCRLESLIYLFWIILLFLPYFTLCFYDALFWATLAHSAFIFFFFFLQTTINYFHLHYVTCIVKFNSTTKIKF